MKPTYKQVLDIINACTVLGGHWNRVIQEGSKEQVALVPYKYGSKSKAVRTAAAHNMRALRVYSEEYTDKRNAILSELTDGACFIGDEPADRPLSAKFQIAERELDKTQIDKDVDLIYIPEEDLNLDQNPLPTVVLEVLSQIPAPKPAPEA